MERLPIEIISASAGSGKTYTLSKKLVDVITNGVQPESVLATTFTNKAASELIERVRSDLFEDRKWEYAQRIFDGYLGTVNSVCGRLLREFAFELGLSPVQDVLPEGDDFYIFERAIAPVVEKYSPEIDPIALRFEMGDWRGILKDIIRKIRQNDIGLKGLAESCEWSWKTFQEVLPMAPPQGNEDRLDKELTEAIRSTYESLKNQEGDSTAATNAVLDKLEIYVRTRTNASAMSWPEWARLAKLQSGAKSRELCDHLTDAAKAHSRHPRLHRDIQTFTRLLFECAGDAIAAFAEFKDKNGLVDFVDQEKLTLELLKMPEVQERLKADLDVIFVDEFQDTSPIQLALFVQFARLASRSIWVGDQKQAIYGFRGTDPTLMDAVIDKIIDPNRLQVLSDSYRSRSGLIAFTNALFERVFEPQGIPPERVRLQSKVVDGPGQEIPLLVWRLSKKDNNIEKDRASDEKATRSLAAAIRSQLEKSDDYLVRDENTKQTRPLRAGDIAILCRTNSKCNQVAKFLEASGIRAAIPRSGLMSTPECVLGFASLRYLVDKDDSLAVAEILHFTESAKSTPKWFTDQLENLAAKTLYPSPIVQELDRLRSGLIHLTPTEALETALNAAKIYESALRWGDGAQRIANIEMLKGLALNYEDQCLFSRGAATPAGLVTFLSQNVRDSDLDIQPPGHDEHAVQVLTYHSAKGLEWPMVVMYDLNWDRDINPFGAHVESDKESFDPTQPLSGRRIRYWPWPYASHKKGVGLDESVQSTQEYKEVALQEQKESMRLLYVGMTRARDYLVFAVGVDTKGNNSTQWLDLLKDKEEKKIVKLPLDEGHQVISIGGEPFDVRLQKFEPFQQKVEKQDKETYTTPASHLNIEYPPAKLIPSQLETDLSDTVSMSKTIALGDRIPLYGNPDMELVGDAIHAFLAVDNYLWKEERRLEMAEQILHNWKVTAITAESLIEVSDRLRSHIEQTYGKDCVWHREWPIHLRKDNQKAKGWIDLLLETSSGFVIVDHKSFPGNVDKWADKAIEYAPQLALYREAVEKATGKRVMGTMIHMPISGVLLQVDAHF